MKKISLLVISAILLGTIQFAPMASAIFFGSPGGNYSPSDVEVYLSGDGSKTDYTSESISFMSSDDVPFPYEEDDAIYISSEDMFDGITVNFSTEVSGNPSANGFFTAEYKTDAGWQSIPFDGVAGNQDFDDENTMIEDGTSFSLVWDRDEMSDWTDSYETIDESDRFAVRIRVTDDYDSQALASTVSLVVFNLELVLTNELGEGVEVSKNELSMMSGSGSDTIVYSSYYYGDGVNRYAIAAPETTGDDYLYDIYASGYVLEPGEETSVDLDQTDVHSYSTTLTTAHVYNMEDDNGTAVELASATATGNGDPVTCSVNENYAYCAISIDQDSDDETTLYADGFLPAVIVNSDREDYSDEQETYNQSMEYAYTVEVEDEAGEAITGATVEGGDSDTACVELDPGQYGCPLALDDTASYRVEMSGYETAVGNFSITRSDDFDAAVNQVVILAESDEEVVEEETDEEDSEEGEEEESDEEETTDEEDSEEGEEDDDEDEEADEEGEEDSDEITTSDEADEAIECEHEFSDITGHWGEKAICIITGKGYVDSLATGEDIYGPNIFTTRVDFLKLVLLNAGFEVEAVEGVEYNDVEEGDAAYKWVSYATDKGFVNGYDDGTFRPNAQINRVEALIMIMKVAGVETFEVTADDVPFTDVQVGQWFDWVVFAGLENGLIRGYADNTFRPDRPISRAEMALIARRVYYSFYISE